MKTFDKDTLTEIIRNRRSIFPQQYNGQELSKEEVELILENGTWAPTHKYTEPWHFRVYSGDSLNELLDFACHIYRDETPYDEYKPQKIEKWQGFKNKLSHMVAICMKRDENEAVPAIEEVMAVACAVQNMHLTATALGLAAYWSTGMGTYTLRMHKYMELSPQDLFLGFLMLGKTDHEQPKGNRHPLSEKVMWISATDHSTFG